MRKYGSQQLDLVSLFLTALSLIVGGYEMLLANCSKLEIDPQGMDEVQDEQRNLDSV